MSSCKNVILFLLLCGTFGLPSAAQQDVSPPPATAVQTTSSATSAAVPAAPPAATPPTTPTAPPCRLPDDPSASSSVVTPDGLITSSDTGPVVLGAGTSIMPTGRILHRQVRPFSQIAFGVKQDSLGAGFAIATPLAQTLNLRLGANFFQYGYGFSVYGMKYNAELDFASGQVNVDWMPFHNSFHISPGFLIYRNHITAAAGVAGGTDFTLDGQSFASSPNDPIHGSANLQFSRTFAPMILFGLENMIPRSRRHISFPTEIGFAYVGQPQIHINLAGTACIDLGCVNSATDATIQQKIQAQQNTLNKDLTLLEFYPIVSTGIAYRF